MAAAATAAAAAAAAATAAAAAVIWGIFTLFSLSILVTTRRHDKKKVDGKKALDSQMVPALLKTRDVSANREKKKCMGRERSCST